MAELRCPMASPPEDLLRKYDRAGPRYTSYPPATQFLPRVGSRDYAGALSRLDGGQPLSMYVHVPFCERRCTYCGCYVIPTLRRSIAAKYLTYLLKEAALARAALKRPLTLGAIHLGGGTPTYLSPEELRDLLNGLKQLFDVEDDVELSVELDPRVTREDHLDALKALGANRLSLGVQDTSAEVQEAIGRFQTRERTVEFFHLCRSKGFESINLDLVYGLPLQTEARFAQTLQTVLALRPERLAVFGYAHVPWIRPHQKAIDPDALPGAAARLRLFSLAHGEIVAQGYRHIGMDHFAKPDDALSRAQDEGSLGRNFMGYTPKRDRKLIGLGVSAIGDLGGAYFQNVKKLSDYFERLDRGELPVERGFLCARDDLARRFVIQEILSNLKLSYNAFLARFEVPFSSYFARETEDLRELERDGLVEITPEGLEVTPAGRLFLRNIAMPFDRYLRSRPPVRETYSKTI